MVVCCVSERSRRSSFFCRPNVTFSASIIALSLGWHIGLTQPIGVQDSTALLTSLLQQAADGTSSVVTVAAGTIIFPQQDRQESRSHPLFSTSLQVGAHLTPILIGARGEINMHRRQDASVEQAQQETQDPSERVNRLAKTDSLVPMRASSPHKDAAQDPKTQDPQVNIFTFAYAYSDIDERALTQDGFSRPFSHLSGQEPVHVVPVSAPPPEKQFPVQPQPLEDGAALALAQAPSPLLYQNEDVTGSLPPSSTASLPPIPLPKPQNVHETTQQSFERLKAYSIHNQKQMDKAHYCLTEAIYFESRGEPEKGQRAVAQVVLNRVRSGVYPSNVCDVVYQNAHRRNKCQFSYLCDGSSLKVKEKDAWKAAERIASEAIAGTNYVKEVGDSTHYHADWVYPTWRHELDRTRKIGIHIFYKMPHIELSKS